MAELQGDRASFEGVRAGHTAAVLQGSAEVAGAALLTAAAIKGGGASAAAGLVPGGQLVTAIGVPVAVGAVTEAAIMAGHGLSAMSKAKAGIERLKEREATIVKESASGDSAEPRPNQKTDAGKSSLEPVQGANNKGRSGKQPRLRELADDPKLSSADRGWIKQELNQIKRGKRKSIRLPGAQQGKPGGKELAHPRGEEAAKGVGYDKANLQDKDLHKIQHKYDDFGRKNKPRGAAQEASETTAGPAQPASADAPKTTVPDPKTPMEPDDR